MTSPPNPFWCETCKNLNCQRHGIHNLYPRECDLVTEAVGCTSHSDFTEKAKPWVTAYQEGVLKGVSTERENLMNELVDIDKFIARHVGGKYIEISEIRQYIHKKIKEHKQENKQEDS